MSDLQSVEKDLREYLEKAENLRREDRLTYLKAIFDKHLIFTKLDHMVTRYDFFQIISDSKREFGALPNSPYLSGVRVDQSELTSLAVAEAVLLYLNRNNLLKKLVKFDYTSPENDLETIED